MIQNLGNGRIRFRFEGTRDSAVHLVGDMNQWNEHSLPMEHSEDGGYVIELQLEPGEYEFKYRVGHDWMNDSAADKYVPNCWGSENSVVVVRADSVRANAESGGTDVQPAF